MILHVSFATIFEDGSMCAGISRLELFVTVVHSFHAVLCPYIAQGPYV